MTANGLYNNRRVIAIHTSLGLMLFQVREDSFLVESTLLLSIADFSVYGADEVQFVRFDGVENLHRGKILVGTTNGVDTYETLFDLSLDAATGVWDRTNRINTGVYTGEILLGKSLDYGGLPPTPVAHAAPPISGAYPVSWTQIRPDLISSYEVVGKSLSDTKFNLIQKINSGAILTTLVTPTSLLEPYEVRVRSLNPDGASDYSNTVYIGLPIAPVLSATYVGVDPNTTTNTIFDVIWTQAVPSMALEFTLEDSKSGIAFTPVQKIAAGIYTTTISVPSIELPHSIRLKTTGVFGDSPYSNIVPINLARSATPVISGIYLGETTYSLTWTEADINQVSGYILYGKGASATVFTPITTINSPSTLFFNISVMGSETPYEVKMMAKGITDVTLDSYLSNTTELIVPPAWADKTMTIAPADAGAFISWGDTWPIVYNKPITTAVFSQGTGVVTSGFPSGISNFTTVSASVVGNTLQTSTTLDYKLESGTIVYPCSLLINGTLTATANLTIIYAPLSGGV
jgi:hypothetical protein